MRVLQISRGFVLIVCSLLFSPVLRSFCSLHNPIRQTHTHTHFVGLNTCIFLCRLPESNGFCSPTSYGTLSLNRAPCALHGTGAEVFEGILFLNGCSFSLFCYEFPEFLLPPLSDKTRPHTHTHTHFLT